jgi:hypothetical protein
MKISGQTPFKLRGPAWKKPPGNKRKKSTCGSGLHDSPMIVKYSHVILYSALLYLLSCAVAVGKLSHNFNQVEEKRGNIS